MGEPYATRRELDQLISRVSQMDEFGTRGIGSVQTLLAEVVKDLAELKSETNARFVTHAQQHHDEALARAVNRRWLVGLAVAILAAIGGLYPYLHAVGHH